MPLNLTLTLTLSLKPTLKPTSLSLNLTAGTSGASHNQTVPCTSITLTLALTLTGPLTMRRVTRITELGFMCISSLGKSEACVCEVFICNLTILRNPYHNPNSH